MEKADFGRQVNSGSVITAFRGGEDASFFLCKELIPGYLEEITGEYTTPEGYFVDEKEAEEFDRQFPGKEKKKLPGQKLR